MISDFVDTIKIAIFLQPEETKAPTAHEKQKIEEGATATKVNLFIGLTFTTLGTIGSSFGIPLSGVTTLYGATLTCYHATKMLQNK